MFFFWLDASARQEWAPGPPVGDVQLLAGFKEAPFFDMKAMENFGSPRCTCTRCGAVFSRSEDSRVSRTVPSQQVLEQPFAGLQQLGAVAVADGRCRIFMRSTQPIMTAFGRV